MRRQLELSNEVAAALSGSNDQILRALEGHVDCQLFLRGNVITLDGEAEAVAAAAVVVRELSDLIEKNRASFGQLKASQPPLSCSRKSSLFMAEQFGCDQFAWNRCAVHAHKGS